MVRKAHFVRCIVLFFVYSNQKNIFRNYFLVSRHATPTRKLMTRLEQDIRRAANPSHELQTRTERLREVERRDAEIVQRLQAVTPSSAEEAELVKQHLSLIDDREQLVQQQHYYNMMVELNETKQAKDDVKLELEQLAVEGSCVCLCVA